MKVLNMKRSDFLKLVFISPVMVLFGEKKMTVQEVIDLAVKENRVISFHCELSNEDIRESIKDNKGCHIRKATRESTTVTVIPSPHLEDWT